MKENTSRLEAFSDAVFAIIITISVLNIHVPADASLHSLVKLIPAFLVYLISFQTVGTYWNNHHNLLPANTKITASVMWANLFLLFSLSLIPFSTGWVGQHIGKPWPTAFYSFVFLLCAISSLLLIWAINAQKINRSKSSLTLKNDWKIIATFILNFIGACVAVFVPLIAYICILLVAFIWLIPDRLSSKL